MLISHSRTDCPQWSLSWKTDIRSSSQEIVFCGFRSSTLPCSWHNWTSTCHLFVSSGHSRFSNKIFRALLISYEYACHMPNPSFTPSFDWQILPHRVYWSEIFSNDSCREKSLYECYVLYIPPPAPQSVSVFQLIMCEGTLSLVTAIRTTRDTQCTHNGTLRRVRVTIFAV